MLKYRGKKRRSQSEAAGLETGSDVCFALSVPDFSRLVKAHCDDDVLPTKVQPSKRRCREIDAKVGRFGGRKVWEGRCKASTVFSWQAYATDPSIDNTTSFGPSSHFLPKATTVRVVIRTHPRTFP